QGGLRGHLRGPEPARLGGDPTGRDRADRPRMSTPIPVDRAVLDQVVRGEHGDPHSVLGPHAGPDGVTVRVLKPLARSVAVRHDGRETPLTHEHGGIWAGVLPHSGAAVPDYRVVVDHGLGPVTLDDPYRFLPTL